MHKRHLTPSAVSENVLYDAIESGPESMQHGENMLEAD
jgi:hypothetical protein